MSLSELLEPIASQFRSLGMPNPIVQWGDPLMKGIVVIVMGSFVEWSGWRGRVAPDKDAAIKDATAQCKLAPWIFLVMALGYTGGVLSLVMQHQPVVESPHFWTRSLVLLLLGINGLISLSFKGDRKVLRTAHAYLESMALCLMFLHAILRLKLGSSI